MDDFQTECVDAFQAECVDDFQAECVDDFKADCVDAPPDPCSTPSQWQVLLIPHS